MTSTGVLLGFSKDDLSPPATPSMTLESGIRSCLAGLVRLESECGLAECSLIWLRNIRILNFHALSVMESPDFYHILFPLRQPVDLCNLSLVLPTNYCGRYNAVRLPSILSLLKSW